MHVHCVEVPVHVTKLLAILDKDGNVKQAPAAAAKAAGEGKDAAGGKKGKKKKKKKPKRPRCVRRGESALVEVTVSRTVCLETYADYRQLGRFMLRRNGATVGVGVVEKILKTG